MANHKSSKKRIVRNEKRREINISRKSRVKTFIKKVLTSITGGDKKVAQENLRVSESEIAKSAGKTMPKARARRKISRLAKKVNAMK